MRKSLVWSVCMALVFGAVALAGDAQKGKKAKKKDEPAAPPPPAPAALYDTLEPAIKVAEEKWKRIAESEKAASFQGDAALVNDKLAAVVKKDGSGVDLYAKGSEGWKRRGHLAPAAGMDPIRIAGFKAAVNDGASVGVEASLGGNRSVTFSLQTGLPILKAAPSGPVERLRIEAPCRFGVLPDFFADDLVVDARDMKVDRTEIPSDNFFLHMLGDDEAILAAVWEKNARDLEIALAGEGSERKIMGTDIFFGDGGSIWCAVLEEKGIWHGEELTREDGMKGKNLEGWTVPFIAKWKGNFTREDGAIVSVPFIEGSSGMLGWESGQTTHKLKSTGGKGGTYTAALAPAPDLNYEAYRNAYVGYMGPMVAYPIARLESDADAQRRGQKGTPLDRLCIDDLLRECLGTQACAYVLDVEARQATSPGIFTCSYGKTPRYFIPAGPRIDSDARAAETWKEDRAFMKREVQDVMFFIKYIQDRINAYLDTRLKILAYLDEMEKKYPDQAEFIGRLRKEMDKPALVFQHPVKPEVRANGEEIFKPWMAEMLKALKIDTPEQAAKGWAAAKAPSIGDPQDARVAELRKQVKVWRSIATMEMARNPAPGAIEIAKEVRKRTEESLRGGAGHHERVTVW